MWPLFNSCLEPEMTNVMVSYSIKMRALELCSMGGQWVWSTRLSLMWPLFDSGLEPEMTNVMVSYCITDGSIRFKLHVWSVGMKRHLSLSWPWFDSRLRLYTMLVEFWVGSLQCYECFFLWAFSYTYMYMALDIFGRGERPGPIFMALFTADFCAYDHDYPLKCKRRISALALWA